MLSYLRKNCKNISHKDSFINLKRFNKYKIVNYTMTKLKEEKYSYQQIKEILSKLLDQDHRCIQTLPTEFHQYSDSLIFLEKPVEPDPYECCGKGCNPCIWDRYDVKVRDFQNVIDMLYDKLNNVEI